MPEIERLDTIEKAKCRVGSWCVSAVNERKHFSQKKPHKNKTTSNEQLIPLDLDQFHIKLGHKRYYFLKETRENELISCQTWKHRKTSCTNRYTTERCTVCLEDFKHRDLLLKLDCSHVFHQTCALRWLQLHKRCPLCQVEITSKVFGKKKERPNFDELATRYGSQVSSSSLLFAGYSNYLF
jgi:RING-finger-containing ubiquitin ligase